MDKIENIETGFIHNISINERKSIVLTGVKKIDSFDKEEFLLETSLGYIVIRGEDLEIVKLDTREGTVSIKGIIVGLSYIDEQARKGKEDSIFNRLFK